MSVNIEHSVKPKARFDTISLCASDACLNITGMNRNAHSTALEASEHRSWVGREQQDEDFVEPSTVRAMAATLDISGEPIADGGVLPPLWHWALFHPTIATAELAVDGHPARGGFLPPVGLPGRMWAGGELTWSTDNPLRVGEAASRHSRIGAIETKQGRTGNLVFVRVEHRVSNARGHSLTEVQNIVYREMSGSTSAPVAPPATDRVAQIERTITPGELLLFRYSALTFNAHRIHFDHPYAVGVEGYPGLVVHGPLIATLLVDLVARHWPGRAMKRFEFKALRPSFAGAPIVFSACEGAQRGDIELWAQDVQGHLAMQARASIT